MKRKFEGPNPNTKWKYVPEEELLDNDRFFGLPEMNEILKKYRFIENVPGHLYEQRTKEWFNIRKNSISASNFSTVLGFWEKKTADFFEGKYPDHEKVLTYVNDFKTGTRTKLPYVASIFAEWGTHHESNGILTFLKAKRNLCVKETGFWKFNNEKIKTKMKIKPKFGASPDGLVYNCSDLEKGYDSEFSSEDEEDDDDDDVKMEDKKNPYFLLKQPRAVLEIKCPTHFLPSYKKEKYWRYKKREPHSKVPYYYIPQIMLQMLCTDTELCYYVSWTPTSGTTIFKIEYDESYIKDMLKFVFKFNLKYIKGKNTPKKNFFWGEKNYRRFLLKTKEVIRKSTKTKKFIEKSVVSNVERNLFK